MPFPGEYKQSQLRFELVIGKTQLDKLSHILLSESPSWLLQVSHSLTLHQSEFLNNSKCDLEYRSLHLKNNKKTSLKFRLRGYWIKKKKKKKKKILHTPHSSSICPSCIQISMSFPNSKSFSPTLRSYKIISKTKWCIISRSLSLFLSLYLVLHHSLSLTVCHTPPFSLYLILHSSLTVSYFTILSLSAFSFHCIYVDRPLSVTLSLSLSPHLLTSQYFFIDLSPNVSWSTSYCIYLPLSLLFYAHLSQHLSPSHFMYLLLCLFIYIHPLQTRAK